MKGLLGRLGDSLECYTCEGDQECVLKQCPEDGQEWSCHNEIRSHAGSYYVKKVNFSSK